MPGEESQETFLSESKTFRIDRKTLNKIIKKNDY